SRGHVPRLFHFRPSPATQSPCNAAHSAPHRKTSVSHTCRGGCKAGGAPQGMRHSAGGSAAGVTKGFVEPFKAQALSVRPLASAIIRVCSGFTGHLLGGGGCGLALHGGEHGAGLLCPRLLGVVGERGGEGGV